MLAGRPTGCNAESRQSVVEIMPAMVQRRVPIRLTRLVRSLKRSASRHPALVSRRRGRESSIRKGCGCTQTDIARIGTDCSNAPRAPHSRPSDT